MTCKGFKKGFSFENKNIKVYEKILTNNLVHCLYLETCGC